MTTPKYKVGETIESDAVGEGIVVDAVWLPNYKQWLYLIQDCPDGVPMPYLEEDL